MNGINLQLVIAMGAALDGGTCNIIPLPEAKCDEFTYNVMTNDGGNCYMFKDAPTVGLCGGFEPSRMSMEWKT